jgi:hypothetical protein
MTAPEARLLVPGRFSSAAVKGGEGELDTIGFSLPESFDPSGQVLSKPGADHRSPQSTSEKPAEK